MGPSKRSLGLFRAEHLARWKVENQTLFQMLRLEYSANFHSKREVFSCSKVPVTEIADDEEYEECHPP